MGRIRKEIASLRKEFRKNTVTMITGAFAFVAALTWNDLIREVVGKTVPQGQEITYRLISAVIVTLVVVLVVYLLSKFKSD